MHFPSYIIHFITHSAVSKTSGTLCSVLKYDFFEHTLIGQAQSLLEDQTCSSLVKRCPEIPACIHYPSSKKTGYWVFTAQIHKVSHMRPAILCIRIIQLTNSAICLLSYTNRQLSYWMEQQKNAFVLIFILKQNVSSECY